MNESFVEVDAQPATASVDLAHHAADVPERSARKVDDVSRPEFSAPHGITVSGKSRFYFGGSGAGAGAGPWPAPLAPGAYSLLASQRPSILSIV